MDDHAGARFLLRPRWLVSHLFVIALAVVMVNLGFWQLRRLDERQTRNDLIRDRRQEAVLPVEQLIAPGDGDDRTNNARYRAVTASGTYDAAATVQVRNRTQEGMPGVWWVTPLVLEDGNRVGVIRGFVRLGDDGEPAQAPAPQGEVRVSGIVAVRDGFDGTAPRDLEPMLDEPSTLPALVLATESQPTESAEDLLAVPMPELSDGPHLSYAVQWFIFSTIAIVGYPLILRRLVRRQGKEVDDTRDEPSDATKDDIDRELEALLRQET